MPSVSSCRIASSVGKVSHHPGGWGGGDWDDKTKPEMPNSWDRTYLPAGDWQHPRGAMHGLAHGEIRKNAKDMDVFQSKPGADSIYPDGLITDEPALARSVLRQRAGLNPGERLLIELAAVLGKDTGSREQ